MSDFKLIKKEGILFDSFLKKMYLISNDNRELEVEMYVESIKGRFKIRFIDVLQFDFFHSEDYIFYNFENTKIIDMGEKYYFSFDSAEGNDISEEDSDLLICKEVEVERWGNAPPS